MKSQYLVTYDHGKKMKVFEADSALSAIAAYRSWIDDPLIAYTKVFMLIEIKVE